MEFPMAHVTAAQEAQSLVESRELIALLRSRAIDESSSNWLLEETTAQNVRIEKYIGHDRLYNHHPHSLAVEFSPFDSVAYYRARTRIRGTLRDAMLLFQDENTGTTGTHLYDHHVDAKQMKTLYTFTNVPMTPEDSLNIKWLILQPNSSFVKNRDFCYMEARRLFQLPSGAQGYIVTGNSVRVDFCPDLKKTHGIIRGLTRDTGTIFFETSDPEYLDVVTFMDINVKGNVPKWMMKKLIKFRSRRTYLMETYIFKNRLSQQQFTGDIDINVALAESCSVCFINFKNDQEKYSCRLCNQVSCSNCSSKHSVNFGLNGFKDMDICSYCIEAVKGSQDNNVRLSSSLDNDSSHKFVMGHLSHNEQLQSIKEGNAAIELLIERATTSLHWRHIETTNEVSICEFTREHHIKQEPHSIALSFSQSSAAFFRAKVKIQATLEETMSLFEDDNTGTSGRHLFDHRKDWKQMKTLYTFPDHSSSTKDYLSIKWAHTHSNTTFARSRDICYLERKKKFELDNVKTCTYGYAVSMDSVNVPFCPSLYKTHGIVRGVVRGSGFVFLETTDPQYIDCFFFADATPNGNVTSWMMKKLMKERCRKISDLSEYIQLNRLSEQTFLGDVNLPTTTGVSDCELCCTSFSSLEKKKSCRLCGKVSCSKCTLKKKVRLENSGYKSLIICTHCFQNLRTKKILEQASSNYSITSYSDLINNGYRMSEGFTSSERSTRSKPVPLNQFSEETITRNSLINNIGSI